MGVIHYGYDDLNLALDAIVRANATEEAYEVAARFGWYELFPGVIYRKENWMKVKTAREILTRAKKDDIFDGDIPEDDSAVVTKAQEIVELAEQAWESHVRGPEVEAILNLAKADQNGGAPEEAEEGHKIATPPKSKEKLEEGHKIADPFTNLPDKLAKSEPWDGYNDATVQEVTEGVNWFAEESPDDILDILKNVYAYEAAHKDRSRILSFVREAWTKFGGGEIAEELPQDETSDEEVDQSESGEIDVEDVEGVSDEAGEDSGADEPESDAEIITESEAGEESGEGPSGEVEPTPEDSGKGSGGGEAPKGAETKLVKLVESELSRERLDGIPKRPEKEAPELPWNWNEITDVQLRDLHMQYASLAYYKTYQRARDERIAMHCKEAADEIRNKLLVSADKYDEKNKEIKVTVLEAQINSDPNVRRWRKAQAKYERFAQQAKHELESLHKVVEALSRLETMRHDSWERARK